MEVSVSSFALGAKCLGIHFTYAEKIPMENSDLKVLKEKRITAYVASQCLWPIFFYHLKRANLVLYHSVQLSLEEFELWTDIMFVNLQSPRASLVSQGC